MQEIKSWGLENLPQSQKCFDSFFCGDSLFMLLNTIFNFSGFTTKKKITNKVYFQVLSFLHSF